MYVGCLVQVHAQLLITIDHGLYMPHHHGYGLYIPGTSVLSRHSSLCSRFTIMACMKRTLAGCPLLFCTCLYCNIDLPLNSVCLADVGLQCCICVQEYTYRHLFKVRRNNIKTLRKATAVVRTGFLILIMSAFHTIIT